MTVPLGPGNLDPAQWTCRLWRESHIDAWAVTHLVSIFHAIWTFLRDTLLLADWPQGVARGD